MTEIEEWRDVPGFEGRYQASSLGRVRSLPRWVNGKFNRPRLKEMRYFSNKPNGKTGYLETALKDAEGRIHRKCAHWAVCLAFNGPPPTDRHQVAHNDGTRTNNRPENLRWATAKENAEDRANHGTDQRGEIQWKTNLTADDVLEIRRDYRPGYGGLTPLADKYGVTRQAIHRIIKRKCWQHV